MGPGGERLTGRARRGIPAHESLDVVGEVGGGNDVAGVLFGHVASIAQDTREDAVVVREFNPKWLYDYKRREALPLEERAERWQSLLRLESVGAVNLNFWDAGFLSVLVPDDALAAFDLGRCYAAIETI